MLMPRTVIEMDRINFVEGFYAQGNICFISGSSRTD